MMIVQESTVPILTTSTTGVADGRWTVTVERVTSKWHAHPEDQRTPRSKRPLTQQSRRWLRVLGVTADELRAYVVRERHTTPNMYGYESNELDVRLVSDKPFVVIKVVEPDEYYDYTRYGFKAARQVYNGQPGRAPELSFAPLVARSFMPDPSSAYDKRRHLNWVQLSELAQIAGVEPAEIIRDYAPFSPSTIYEPNVPLARGNASSVQGKHSPNLIRVYAGELPDGYCIAETDWGGDNAATLRSFLRSLLDSNTWDFSELWVPQTFANRVIRLAQFGFRPGQPLSGASCRVEAPMPAQPQMPLPILSEEQLCDLHDLRMELLGGELTEKVFRREALRALGLPLESEWREARESTDPLNGFAYNTNFTVVDRIVSDGQVVISTCFWTRAGASQSNNFYCGFLAVFPPGITVTDARRDPRAILRIWFWPGELVRQSPVGSEGGLCPATVPTGCATLVQRFLLGLGYDY